VVGRVHTGTDTLVSDQDLDVFRETLGDRLDTGSLQDALRVLVAELVSRGRPYTQVRILALDVSAPPTVNIELAVYSGPEVYTGSLVTGASRTDEHVFEREAGWRRGVLLESNVISESQQKLEALPYVAAMDTAMLLAVSGDTADLYLGVEEAVGVKATGAVGWVPESAQSAGYWAGEFDLELRSAFGDGRHIGLSAARPDPQSQRTRVHFWEPWPLGAPLWLGVDLSQEDFGTDLIETRAALAVRLATAEPRWQFAAAWGQVTVEEAPSPETFPAEYLQAGIAAIDSSATAAYRFEFNWSTHSLKARDSVAPPQDRMEFTQGHFAAYRLWPMSRALYSRTLVTGGGTLLGSAEVPQHLLYRVGGTHTLRGYREQQFAVRDYLRLAWEGHLGNLAQSLFVFAEGAWLNFPTEPDRILGSAGLGLRIAGRVSLTAGVPSEGGLAETKVHLSVTTGR